MAHLLQVGAGSGGMPVLDLLCRDARITRLTLIEPDVYKPHNVERHLFPPSAIGAPKAALAEAWLKERRPDLEPRSHASVPRQDRRSGGRRAHDLPARRQECGARTGGRRGRRWRSA